MFKEIIWSLEMRENERGSDFKGFERNISNKSYWTYFFCKFVKHSFLFVNDDIY